MGLIRPLLFLFAMTVSAWAIDGITPTITSVADLNSRRTTLITQVWGTASVPATLPTVTTITLPVFTPPLTNVARVDQYVAAMSNGQSNTSNFYLANSPNVNRVVMLNMGHQGPPFDCNWTTFATVYRTKEVLQALLSAGYSVFAMNMPACGDYNVHGLSPSSPGSMFVTWGNAAMGYFIEPAIQAMNYWDINYPQFRGSYNATGLSGGGWTTTVLAAIDPRIKISIPIAGSWPGIIHAPVSDTSGDAEQEWTNFYTVAGYADLYVMASYGPGRRSFQILNFADDCCFGNTQFTTLGAASLVPSNYYGVDYRTFQRNYTQAVQVVQGSTNIKPINFGSAIDDVATAHMISAWAQAQILSLLGTTQTGGIAWLH